jgi:hypothetical protein
MNGEEICTKNAQQKNVKAHFLKSIYINTKKNVQIGGGKGRVYIYSNTQKNVRIGERGQREENSHVGR